MRFGGDVGLKNNLGQTFAVPEVNEHRPAMVTPILHPTEKHDLLADIPSGQLSAGVGALNLGNKFHCHVSGQPVKRKGRADSEALLAASKQKECSDNTPSWEIPFYEWRNEMPLLATASRALTVARGMLAT
jgi:hypothetical protein